MRHVHGMNILKKTYNWVLGWADSRWGAAALFVLAFAESSFFPIPPDVLLIALGLGCAAKAFRYALICTIGSVLGAMAGYAIGHYLWQTPGGEFTAIADFFFRIIPGFTHTEYDKICAMYNQYNFWVVFTAGFSPIPYKLITITAGVFKIDFPVFLVASVVSRGLRGFNVTIPYKQAIVPYLSGLSDEARAIGAVNCVKITPEGLTGYNTDAYGFRRSLLNLLGDVRPEKALVLGTGGASKAVKYVLEQLGIAFDAVSRDGKNGAYTYGDLSEEIVRAHRLIVNATPLGTFPNVEGCPVLPYEALGAGHFLFDLVYNPAVTEFLKRGAAQGAATRNGYDMLVGQAEKAWEIWNE